jgi:protein-disulfide isomerase
MESINKHFGIRLLILAVLLLTALSGICSAQNIDKNDTTARSTTEIVASTKYRTYSLADVSADTREAFLQVDAEVEKQRTTLLEKQIGDLLLRAEARARGITIDELRRMEILNHVSGPAEDDIKTYYDAHRTELDNKPFDEVKPNITRYLHWQAEARQRRKFIGELKIKYTVKNLKDVNSPGLAPDDVLASVGDDKIAVREFEDASSAPIWGTRADAYETVIEELEKVIFADLLSIESKKRHLASGDELLKNSAGGSEEAADRLKDKLFAKYHAKIYLKRPQYFRDIDVAGAPSRGSSKAAVTVVMFSDFQCSHCAEAHPMVSKVVAEFGNKVRFVVKNYPLVSIHPNAFRAAEAAAAAQAQGKFFEYIDVLYRNQDALGDEPLKKFASNLGLDRKRFDESLSSEEFAPRIKKDIAEAERIGLFGTPTVFVNGSEIYALSGRNLRAAIREAIKK